MASAANGEFSIENPPSSSIVTTSSNVSLCLQFQELLKIDTLQISTQGSATFISSTGRGRGAIKAPRGRRPNGEAIEHLKPVVVV